MPKSFLRYGGNYLWYIKERRYLQYMNPDNYRNYFLFYCLIILAGLLILYGKFIFSDTMLKSGDMLQAGVFFRMFLVDHVKAHGSVPLWNPCIFCGLPFVGAIHGDIFYPLSFLKFLFAVPRALGWTFVIHIYLAGITSYLTARQLKLSKLGATFVGVAYMFSGWLNSLVYPGHDSKIYVTALFPLIILFVHRSFEKKRFFNYTLGGVVVGCIILSPHPQMAFFSLWAMAAFILYGMWIYRPRTGRFSFVAGHAGLAVYAVILGMMLGAIQFLPAWQYVRHDSPRSLYQNKYSFSASWSLHEEELFSLMVPEFAGADLGDGSTDYWGRNYIKDNSEYAGLVALLAALAGLVLARRRGKYFFASMAGASLLYALGDTTPVFKLLYDYIPLVRLTRAPSMIMFMFSFAVAMLGGMGVEALAVRKPDDRAGGFRWLIAALMGVTISSFIVAILFAGAGTEMLEVYSRVFYPQLTDMPGKWQAAQANLAAIRPGLWTAAALSALVLVIAAASRRRRFAIAVVALLPLLAMADGIRFDRQFIQTLDYKKEFELRPMVDFLIHHAGNYRAYGYALNETDYHTHCYGIRSPIGYHGNETARYYRFLRHLPGWAHNIADSRFANLVGARYIMMPANTDIESLGFGDGDLVKSAEFGRNMVVENTTCFPRTYLVGRYRVIPRPDSINDLIYEGTDDLRHLVYLEHDPGADISDQTAPGDTAEIVHYGVDSILIRSSCATPKILTISDNYHKDWHVFIDGRESEPLITYGTFRGVVVPGGQHEVVWKFIPGAYLTGKKMTLAATAYLFIACAGCLMYGRGKKRRQCR